VHSEREVNPDAVVSLVRNSPEGGLHAFVRIGCSHRRSPVQAARREITVKRGCCSIVHNDLKEVKPLLKKPAPSPRCAGPARATPHRWTWRSPANGRAVSWRLIESYARRTLSEVELPAYHSNEQARHAKGERPPSYISLHHPSPRLISAIVRFLSINC
jgi:hypothetical protein